MSKGALSFSQQYHKAVVDGNLDRCIELEMQHGLFGYPPDLVSVGLRAVDNGHDAALAVLDYISDLGEES